MRSPLRLVAPLAALALACAANGAPRVLWEGDSKFNHLIVEEDARGVRRLYFERDGAVQSAIRPGSPLELLVPYCRMSMVALAVVPAPRRVLVIGLGGGAMPMFLRTLYPEAVIDAVDIDPEVVRVAKKHFGFTEDARMKAHVADGRAFVERAEGGWDLVFLDAYGKGSIPRHLATVEFLRTLKGKLAEGGLVVGNVWGPLHNPLYDSMVRTYATAFGGVCVKGVPASGNRIFFVNREMPPAPKLLEAARTFSLARKLPFDLADYARAACESHFDPAAPLIEDVP